MGSAKDNTGKWYVFSDGDVLWADQSNGSDLNVDLQKNIADELDSTINMTIGSCIIGAEAFRITPGAGNCSVNISSGYAIIDGQRCRMEDNISFQNMSYPATHTFYLEIDSDLDIYNIENMAWPTKMTRLTSGKPSGSYLTIGSVLLTANQPVTLTSIKDNRIIHETQGVISNSLNDNLIPEKNAGSIRHRLGMFANRIKEIIGAESSITIAGSRQDWMDPLPGDGEGSLTGIWGKFDIASGHSHDGAGNSGGSINAVNIISTTTIGVNSTNVQGAIEQLDNKKLALNGSQPMTGLLTLSGNPTAPNHAATKQYVDQAVRVKQLVQRVIPVGNTVAYGDPATLLESPASITTSGGILKFEAGTGVTAAPQSSASYPWDPFLRFYLFRNNSQVQVQTIEVLMNPPLDVSPQFIFIPIPIFYDNPGVGTYTYDIRWNFSIPVYPTPTITYNFSTGRSAGISGAASYWYIIES